MPTQKMSTRKQEKQSAVQSENEEVDTVQGESAESQAQDPQNTLSEVSARLQQQHEENQELTETIEQLRREIRKLHHAQSSRAPSRPSSRAESLDRSSSPTTSISNFKLSDGAKLFWKQVPDYNGTGGPQKLYAFFESFEEFAGVAEVTSQFEAKLAASKLSGDAKMWWLEHKQATSVTDPKRIQTWEDMKRGLREAFAPVEYTRIIRDKLRTIRQRGSVADYNAAFTRLTMQIPNLSFEEAEFDYLQGLKPELRNLIRTKDNITDMNTLKNACLKLDTQKRERQDEAHLTEPPSRNRQGQGAQYRKHDGKCSYCMKYGHREEDCRKKQRDKTQSNQSSQSSQSTQSTRRIPRDMSKVTCHFCDKAGHYQRDCIEYANAKNKRTGAQALFASTGSTIIDSGATQHMFNTLDAFNDDVRQEVTHITCANKETVEATHVGSVNLDLNGTPRALHDVLHVPRLKHNLVSVPALTKDGNRVVFEPDGTVTLTDNDKNSYEIGYKVGDLYHLLTSREAYLTAVKQGEDLFTIWHHRLGHPGINILQTISKYVDGVGDLIPPSSAKICEGCAHAKSHRLPFPKTAENRAKQVLERVHSDLCGPLPPSLIGSRYIVTFIDDASRYAHLYFVEHKNDTFGIFQQFQALVERQTGQSIKILRSDGGGEYVNHEMRNYLLKHGIHHETTTANTPQQNGVAERYNRTLQDTIRAIMHAAGMPDKLWAEVAATAAYLRNRVPTRANADNKTPYELWYNRKPNIEHLRIIWSDAYAHVPKNKRHQTKLSLRAKRLKLIGYHEQKKAYRLWNPEQERIEISRDVIFDETCVLNHIPSIVADDEQEYEIESIIGERTNNGEREFLVKWAGYDNEEDNTWEPLRHVEDTQALDIWENRQSQSHIATTGIDIDVTSDEPTNYSEAMSSPEAAYWRDAINKELESIHKNNTWTLIDRDKLPVGRKPIGCKWVFRRKLNSNGAIERYKARLVAKGFNQQHGVDFEETFAPVAKFTSIRALLAIGALLDLHIHQMDVKSAFLYGELDDSEELYMEVPEGITGHDDKVCKLNRTLYGLKQASRRWYERLCTFMASQNFKRITADFCIFLRRREDELTIIAVYVDDTIILSNSISAMQSIKLALSQTFEMTDCGELEYCLGIRVKRYRQRRIISLDQEQFTEQVLRRFNMQDCKPVGTPLDPSIKLTQATDDNPADTSLTTQYRQIIGSLMYLMIGMRPDIAASISILSQFSAKPTQAHLQAAKRVLHYLKGTQDYRLHLGAIDQKNQGEIRLYGFSDANWGNDLDTRRSTSGYIFFISEGPISWASKRQSTVALSSTEAEYMALTQAAKEAIWLRRLLAELGFRTQEPTIIHEDNQSAIALAKNPVYHARSKHIDIQHHFIRDKVESGEVDLSYTPTENMIADVLTKPLPKTRFRDLVISMGLRQAENNHVQDHHS